jgi:hypothetical protein
MNQPSYTSKCDKWLADWNWYKTSSTQKTQKSPTSCAPFVAGSSSPKMQHMGKWYESHTYSLYEQTVDHLCKIITGETVHLLYGVPQKSRFFQTVIRVLQLYCRVKTTDHPRKSPFGRIPGVLFLFTVSYLTLYFINWSIDSRNSSYK